MSKTMSHSALFGQIKEYDDRRIPHRRVVAGEFEAAGLAIDLEGRDGVRALVAAVEELAGGIEVEAPGIVAASPFLAEVFQSAVRGDGEDADAVVQPVPRVDEFSVGGDENFRAEIAAGEAFREGGNRLASREPAGVCGVVIEDDGGAFFLDRIEPAAAGVKVEVTRAVPGRERDGWGVSRDEFSFLGVEFPDEDFVE